MIYFCIIEWIEDIKTKLTASGIGFIETEPYLLKLEGKNRSVDLYLLNTGDSFSGRIEKCILLHEDIFRARKNHVIQRLVSLLGLIQNRIHGRQIKIHKIDRLTGRQFINDNHLLSDGGGSIYLGLFSTNNLVGVASFSKPLFMKHEEPAYYSSVLIRFCTLSHTTVVGGLDKVIQYYLRTYQPNDIITFVDREWSTGLTYETIGFECIGQTEPLTFIISNGERTVLGKDAAANEKQIIIRNHGNLKFQLKCAK